MRHGVYGNVHLNASFVGVFHRLGKLVERKVVCRGAHSEDLARKIAADGEGATKLVTVDVLGAANEQDAETVARAIANSPLVKTAIFGHDANWGRVAAGRSIFSFKLSV